MDWLRLYTEVIDDRRFHQMPAELYRRWTFLLILTRRGDGCLPPLADIAFSLRISEQDATDTLAALAGYGLIDRAQNGRMTPHNWTGRQFESDSSTQRVRAFRAKRSGNVSETPRAQTEQTQTRTETDQTQTREESVVATEAGPTPAIASPDGDGQPAPDGANGSGTGAAWPNDAWIDATFEQSFWPEYPRKTHKAEARKAFRALCRGQPSYRRAYDLVEHILEAVSEQSEQWRDPAYTPHAATYLRGERWADEVVIATGPAAGRLNGRTRSPP